MVNFEKSAATHDSNFKRDERREKQIDGFEGELAKVQEKITRLEQVRKGLELSIQALIGIEGGEEAFEKLKAAEASVKELTDENGTLFADRRRLKVLIEQAKIDAGATPEVVE